MAREVDVAEDALEYVLDGADAVVHLAWRFQPTRRRTVTWQSNVVGSRRLLAGAIAAGCGTFVHASSVGAYSPPPTGRRDERVAETHPTDSVPTAAYGTQKSYLERCLDAVEAEHPELRVVRLRSAFVFQRPASPSQRRIFAGPFVPGWLLGGRHLPVVPIPDGLRFQAVHADDLASAYVAAAISYEARGAFNVAGPGVIDGAELGHLLGARPLRVSEGAVRRAMAAAYAARLIPAEPGLFELFNSLPLMDTGRVESELGWTARHTGAEALAAFLDGLRDAEGKATPPLDAHAGGPLRAGELGFSQHG